MNKVIQNIFGGLLNFYMFISFFILFVIFLSMSFFMKENFKPVSRLNRELVFFSMNSCGHCKDFKPVWDLLVKNYGNNNYIDLRHVIYEERPELIEKYGVQSFPTILALKDGKINMKYSGNRTYEDLVRFLNHAMSD